MAPPPRSRLATPQAISLPAPPTQLPHQTRKRRPDLPAAGIHDQEQKEKTASHSTESDSKTETSETGTNTSSGTDDDDEDQADNKHNANDHDNREGKIIFICDVLLFSFFFHC